MLEKSAFVRRLREIGERYANRDALIIVDSDCIWSKEWVLEARDMLASSSRYARFRIVFQSDARQTCTLLRQHPDLQDELGIEGILLLQLKPWHPFTLGLWMSDCFLKDNPQDMKLIEQATGNWPGLLYRLHEKARQTPHQLKQHVEEFQKEILRPEVVRQILGEFGIEREEDFKVFQYLAMDNGREEDIAQHYQLPVELVRSVLSAAELLGTAHRIGKGYWKANPLVAKLVLEAGDPA